VRPAPAVGPRGIPRARRARDLPWRPGGRRCPFGPGRPSPSAPPWRREAPRSCPSSMEDAGAW